MTEEKNYCVYGHRTPDGMYYYGITKQNLKERWQPSNYKGLALEPYIEQFGWDNIEHRVLVDGLDYETALKVEDWFITKATKDGFCINKKRSGLIAKDINEYDKQYYTEHREERKQYDKQRNSTPERKIYYRVAAFNRYHPDKKIVTPSEAVEMYELTEWIPDFIKNDDLRP